jgi:phosphoserine/homoserine phosphotransferase
MQHIVCLDLEGVLIPEIWIEFSEAAGIPELRRTTRDEPDYDKLMQFRIDLLKERGLNLDDIQKVISGMNPLDGALDFVQNLRERCQLIILSDTFEEFAKPMMKKLGFPTLFCNSLVVNTDKMITSYTLRQKDGKKHAVDALESINMKIFAAGDSFNDLSMIQNAHSGCLFRAPESIKLQYPQIPAVETYTDLLNHIDAFLRELP